VNNRTAASALQTHHGRNTAKNQQNTHKRSIGNFQPVPRFNTHVNPVLAGYSGNVEILKPLPKGQAISLGQQHNRE
jgi:hypothetical protein